MEEFVLFKEIWKTDKQKNVVDLICMNNASFSLLYVNNHMHTI